MVALDINNLKRGELRRLFVARSWRGRRVAQRLLATLLAHSRQEGLWYVELTTANLQPEVLRVYAKAGWVVVGTGRVGRWLPWRWVRMQNALPASRGGGAT